MPRLSRPKRRVVPPEEDVLPDLDGLLDDPEPVATKPKQVRQPKLGRNATASKFGDDKPVRELAAMDPKVVKSNPTGFDSLEALRTFVKEDESFDVNDLNAMAEIFLPKSLRTPPDPNELKRLRQQRLEQEKEREEKYRREQAEISRQYGESDISNGV